jgi:hypothetical protein
MEFCSSAVLCAFQDTQTWHPTETNS